MSKKKVAVNLKRLIEILGQHLYSKPEICIRELIQNCHDSLLLRSRSHPQIKKNIQIQIKTNKADRTLAFIDTGIGMSLEEIHQRLSRIANSAKDELRQKFSRIPSESNSILILGSFGIGFLSSFLIAEHVSVKTKVANTQGDAILWTSVGDEFYETASVPCPSDFFGTEITLTLKTPFLHFLDNEWIIGKIIQFCDFITYPIYFNDQTKPINMQMPPWRNFESVDKDYIAYLHRNSPGLKIIGGIPIQWDGIIGGVVGIPALPTNHEKGISLHNDRIYISDTKKLLPQSLSFLVGIIDTTGLSLLLNREQYISDSNSARLKTHFTLKISEGLKKIAQFEKHTFQEIVEVWGRRLKMAAIENDAVFEQIGEFLQMPICGEKLNMATIIERYKNADESDKIIYMDNESTQHQYSSMLSQFGYPVVEMDDNIDFEFLNKYARKKHLKIEPANLSIISLIEPSENNSWSRVIQEITAFVETDNAGHIGSIQTAVFKMHDIPALICTQHKGETDLTNILKSDRLPVELKQILANLQKENRVLFLNISHPLTLELKKLVASDSGTSGTHIKSKIILMRGLLNAAAIHSGDYKPSALNKFLKDMTSALLFIAEMQNCINPNRNEIPSE